MKCIRKIIVYSKQGLSQETKEGVWGLKSPSGVQGQSSRGDLEAKPETHAEFPAMTGGDMYPLGYATDSKVQMTGDFPHQT